MQGFHLDDWCNADIGIFFFFDFLSTKEKKFRVIKKTFFH